MIIRGNIVYNNWNRIRFYVTQLPDNSGNNNPNYGTANFQSIWDGQGIYVTRSDPEYAGTFLFENNLCLNNGKNGINFDHSHSASRFIKIIHFTIMVFMRLYKTFLKQKVIQHTEDKK